MFYSFIYCHAFNYAAYILYIYIQVFGNLQWKYILFIYVSPQICMTFT
jgi:hypothetical protein